MRTAVAAGLVVAVLAGCAPAAEKSQAQSAAARFADALMQRDGAAACQLLTDAARSALETTSAEACDQAVVDVRSSTGKTSAQVWGDEAQVRIGDDTIFLDRTARGWRVRAAGCEPQGGDRPYECEVAP